MAEKKYAGAVLDGPMMGQNIIKRTNRFRAITTKIPPLSDEPNDDEPIDHGEVWYKFDEKLEVWKLEKQR